MSQRAHWRMASPVRHHSRLVLTTEGQTKEKEISSIILGCNRGLEEGRKRVSLYCLQRRIITAKTWTRLLSFSLSWHTSEATRLLKQMPTYADGGCYCNTWIGLKIKVIEDSIKTDSILILLALFELSKQKVVSQGFLIRNPLLRKK